MVTDNVLDINDLLSQEVRRVDFSADIRLSDAPVKLDRPVHIEGEVLNMATYIEFRSTVVYTYTAQCSRCLKEFAKELELELVFPVAVSLENGDTDEYLVPENGRIDLAALCGENLILNLPMRELCREDCKGLCPVCGKDLNEGDCSCPKEVDPRLAELAGFFKE